ncbi:hypothetical protein AGMMS50230_04470 [Spirochaetia bacterium]|nr:hypothetical protein AGMMS50230_04470 [Spirochaetia bacterium]
MGRSKYLLVPWLVLAVYTIISLHSGAAGIVSYRELLVEREKILENLDRLERVNQELEGAMDALLYDSESIRVRARELGYGAANERFVRIVGLPGAKRSDLRPGMIRTAIQPRAVSDKAHRITALCMGLLLFAFFLAGDMLFKKETARPADEVRTIYP